MPESRRASLYSVKVIKMSRLAIHHLLTLCSLHGSLCCCETEFLSSDTQVIEIGQLPKLHLTPLHFLTAPICSCDRVCNLLSASDRNHVNRPNIFNGN